MRDCEHVEAFVHGELDHLRRAAMRAHLLTCARCRREAAWLRAERRVFAERTQRESWTVPSFDELATPRQPLVYEAVAIAEEPSVERRWWIPAALVLSAAAAFAALLPSPPALEPRSEEAVPAAYDEACSELTPLEPRSCELPAASSNSSEVAASEPACPLTGEQCLEAPLCSMPEM